MKLAQATVIGLIAMFLLTNAASFGQINEGTLQIDLSKLLNARQVTTLTDGKLVPWSGTGWDSGYLTKAASLNLNKDDVNPMALPDNPVFPATAEHPEVVLHYSNSDGVSKQVISLSDEEGIKFEVPSGKYSKLFLAFTSVRGASHMKVDLQYADGVESKTFELRDCYADLPASDSNSCYLAHNLAKWDKANHMQEKDHHNIDLLNVQPDPKRNLIQIQITKTKEITQLTLWAATAVIAK